jgi:hypothetical protein
VESKEEWGEICGVGWEERAAGWRLECWGLVWFA